jgi:hypothetical protein
VELKLHEFLTSALDRFFFVFLLWSFAYIFLHFSFLFFCVLYLSFNISCSFPYFILYLFFFVLSRVRGTRTGSSSDDWILLVLRVQPLLITLNHNAIAVLHTLQSLTLIFSVQICI